MNSDNTETPRPEWVVYCPTHRNYLARLTAISVVWRADQSEAKRFDKKHEAVTAAKRTTFGDHNPTPWAIAGGAGSL